MKLTESKIRYYLSSFLLFVANSVNFAEAVPANYCNSPFNRSDCGRAPTPVFAYWKPGSRCEVKIWRGCPTLNRFDNEMTCNHYCVGRLKLDSLEDIDSDENKVDSTPDDPCDGVLNTDDCGRLSTIVYTYNQEKKACVKAEWKGCETKNMFRSKEKCTKICKKFGDIAGWAKKIEKLTPDQLRKLNAMLDEYLSGRQSSGNERLLRLSEDISKDSKHNSGATNDAANMNEALATNKPTNKPAVTNKAVARNDATATNKPAATNDAAYTTHSAYTSDAVYSTYAGYSEGRLNHA